MFFAVSPCLWGGKHFSSGKEPVENSPATPMLQHLVYKIKSTGPITVAEYMKEVLTNPVKVCGSGSPRTGPALADLRGVSRERCARTGARASSAPTAGVPSRGRAAPRDPRTIQEC